MKPAKKKWMGSTPQRCDVCLLPFKWWFIDGKLSIGPWGLICVSCHATHGCGLGTGRGQKYNLKTLEKVEG
jgi:hypothetical protein